jgi:hypothetical protein
MKRLIPSIMVECSKEAQENDNKEGIERFNISKKCIRFHIIRSIVIAILLIFCYCIILQIKTTVRAPLLLIHGSVVALLLGHLWTTTFLEVIRKHIYCYAQKYKEKIDDIYTQSLPLPATVLGVIERIFFGALVAFDISATAAAMVTWIFVKMATDWNRILVAGSKKGPRSLAFGSLLASMISLFFALIGGLICRKALHP